MRGCSRGGMCGCSGGEGGMCGCSGGGGHVWLLWGGAWLLWGVCMVLFRGACMVLFRGACMVLFGGHAWFYLGGGVYGFFSFFGYNEIRSMSGRYASYWNAFLFGIFARTVTYGVYCIKWPSSGPVSSGNKKN